MNNEAFEAQLLFIGLKPLSKRAVLLPTHSAYAYTKEGDEKNPLVIVDVASYKRHYDTITWSEDSGVKPSLTLSSPDIRMDTITLIHAVVKERG
mgnify:CR=1 FL=1